MAAFSTLFWSVFLPALLIAITAASIAVVRFEDRTLLDVISVAVVAGVVGTLGYDLFRMPFVFGLGMRLLSPIESYGVLLLDAGGSSGATDFAGWTYHFANGIGFAVAYAMFAAGRHWAWGVLWAMVLESATVVTPFADAYALRGKVWPIVIAYLAHIPYGLSIGWFLRDPERSSRALRGMISRPALAVSAAVLGFLAVWLSPWEAPAPGGSAVIVDERLVPEFVTTDDLGCVDLQNRDAQSYAVTLDGEPEASVGSSSSILVCTERRGVFRVRTSHRPFDGGFVITP